MRRVLGERLGTRLVARRERWQTRNDMTAILTLEFASPQTLRTIDLREAIADGQRVARWTLRTTGAGARLVTQGSTIGYRQLRRLDVADVTGLELALETIESPKRVVLHAYS
jgi:alpha-L-fucosidase